MQTKTKYFEKALDLTHGKLTFSKPILVVEDQLSVAHYTKARFHERWNCEVILSHSYKSTQWQISQHGGNFQIAISDLHLPDAPKGEIVDLLIGTNIPTLVLSAAFGEKLRSMVLDKGVVDYVLKNSPNAYKYIGDVVERLEKTN
jgi:DNA-binding response OmpR family regulator